MRFQGRLVEWNDARGYGFVVSDGKNERVFVHITAFPNGSRRPVRGDKITYTMARDGKGRPRAADIRFVNAGARNAFAFIFSKAFAVCLFFAFLIGAALLGRIHFAIPAAYAIASLVAYAAYAVDKSAARNNKRRISEKLLHILELVGGWPGAWLAQGRLRHKSRKTSFRIVFWLMVTINCAILCWFFTKNGAAFHRDFFDQLLKSFH